MSQTLDQVNAHARLLKAEQRTRTQRRLHGVMDSTPHWTSAELLTFPLHLVRDRATRDVLNRRRQRQILGAMIKPAIAAGLLFVGYLMQSAGLHWDQIVSGLIGTALALVGVAIKAFWDSRKETLRLRSESDGQLHRTSEAIAKLDFEERQRIDSKQEQFIEMVRDMHVQQTQNMQSIINNQNAIIENQKEAMKTKDSELLRREVQMGEMQKELIQKQMQHIEKDQ